MQIWNIRLFGSLRVSREREDDAFFRFSTRKTGALLAFLAFHQDQRHSREALCELLWPDEPPDKSRARLRVALTSLRHQLEPPGVPSGSVIRADGHEQLSLAGGTVATDVAEVEQALRLFQGSPLGGPDIARKVAGAQRIAALCDSPLLTGFYDDWVITERDRLNQSAVVCLSALAPHAPPDVGLELARRASLLDPLAEEPIVALLPLLSSLSQPGEARRVFQAFCRRTEAAFGTAPSPALLALAESLPGSGTSPAGAAPPARPAPPEAVPMIPVPASPVWTHRLPSYLTRYIGRDDDNAALRTALRESRLVTVTGPGGTGKTRLAVETARHWEGATFFVPLADTTEPTGIPAAVCQSLGEKGRIIPDTAESLLAHAADVLRRAASPLLVLDNLEQVADAAGSVVLSLLERVPSLRLLVTSRLRLFVPGEREFPLAPLPVPPPLPVQALADAARVASVALFVDRTRAARPDFQITDRNGGDVVTVCRLLEGNPLAIELVAARGGTLVPAQMREKLTERGSLLLHNRHAEPGSRHHSLYTAIDWSYQLLSPDLRRFFARLSVFRGGFTSGAAAAVCAVPSETDSAEALARLRSHSLVESRADDTEMRFSLLESLRSFGASQLAEVEADDARERHAVWYADLAERADTGLAGSQQALWLLRLDTERENLRAALDHDLTQNPLRALQIAGGIWTYWDLRGRPTEGRVWLERALAAAPFLDQDGKSETTDNRIRFHRSRALQGAGALALLQGDGAAADSLYDECLRLRRQSGDTVGVASVLNSLGLLALSRQEWDEAKGFISESLALRRTTGDTSELAGPLLNLGVVEWERGDHAAARPQFDEALLLFRQSGDRVGEARTLNNLGGIALSQGDFALAEKYYEQSLAIKRTLAYAPGIAITLANVGVCALYQGHLAVAAAYFEESVAIYREMDAPERIAEQVLNLAQVATYRGEWDRAYALLTESLTLLRESENPTDIAGNLEGFALYAAERGNAPTTARLLGRADTLRTETDCPLYPSERVAVDHAADLARKTLGADAFEEAFRAGAADTLDDAVRAAFLLKP